MALQLIFGGTEGHEEDWNLHFIDFRLKTLHFADNCSAFWVLNPTSYASVWAVVTAELRESNACNGINFNLAQKLLTKFHFFLPWTWPNTSKSHWTNKFESSIPITFWNFTWKIRSLLQRLCHRSITLKLQLKLRIELKSEIEARSSEVFTRFSCFLDTSLSPAKEK